MLILCLSGLVSVITALCLISRLFSDTRIGAGGVTPESVQAAIWLMTFALELYFAFMWLDIALFEAERRSRNDV